MHIKSIKRILRVSNKFCLCLQISLDQLLMHSFFCCHLATLWLNSHSRSPHSSSVCACVCVFELCSSYCCFTRTAEHAMGTATRAIAILCEHTRMCLNSHRTQCASVCVCCVVLLATEMKPVRIINM